jgi:hypothetical protein
MALAAVGGFLLGFSFSMLGGFAAKAVGFSPFLGSLAGLAIAIGIILV